MRVSLARKFGKSIAFVGVLESHKSGIAHLHLLIGQYIVSKLALAGMESYRRRQDRRYPVGGRASGFRLSLRVSGRG